jgi:hypothetical protein
MGAMRCAWQTTGPRCRGHACVTVTRASVRGATRLSRVAAHEGKRTENAMIMPWNSRSASCCPLKSCRSRLKSAMNAGSFAKESAAAREASARTSRRCRVVTAMALGLHHVYSPTHHVPILYPHISRMSCRSPLKQVSSEASTLVARCDQYVCVLQGSRRCCDRTARNSSVKQNNARGGSAAIRH